MTHVSALNSTNVRLYALASAAGLLLGCASTPPSPTAMRACPAAAIVVCESFGPERHCRCEPRADIGVLRDALTGPAWRNGLTR